MDDQETNNDNVGMEFYDIREDDNNIELNSETNTTQDQLKPNEDKMIDYFINEHLWDKIGKKIEDYDVNDMDMLKWKSLEDCIDFYYTYAKVKGFGVRKDTTGRSRKDGHLISKKLVCRVEGHRHEKWINLPDRKRDARPFTRMGCPAFIQFKFHEEYKFWKVVKFHAEHCHPMVDPKQVPYIRSFRSITEADEIKINTMHKSGIAPNRIMQHFVNESGSHENVGFIKKDLYNHIQRIKKEEVQDGDAETVMAYLLGKKATDPSFFVSHTRDEHENLEKLFWCDGISRIDYKTFGHALAFDTTYKCNAYNKPFVVLVGVNHHRNTVPFGCALVVNEKQDTYVWVLEQLIEAGDGYKPLTVITDGDKAMANAINQVLPEARHRLCLWHLMRNVKANGAKEFAKGFLKCVHKCRTPNDFENAWRELLQVHECEDRRWAKELYETKEKWAEAYMRGYFFAGMRSTQRCESMHRTLKRMLDRKVMLYRFVGYYYQELNTLRWEEARQDYRTTNEHPSCTGVLSSLKKHAAQVYTRNSFAILCSEMSYEGFYLVKDVKYSDGPNRLVFYWLQHVEYEKYWYLVIKDIILDTMYCCCMKLESLGYPCRHIFAVLKYENAKELPRGCILTRWTRYAKEVVKLSNENDGVESNNPAGIQARYSYLASFCMNLCQRASQTYQAFTEIRDQFAKMSLNLQGMQVTRKKKKKTQEPFGIGDPLIIDNGRGQHKKKKVRALESPPSQGHELQNNKESLTPKKLDLNKIPKQSPNKDSENMDSTSAPHLSKITMSYMPNTYEEGDVSKASYNHELENMEDDVTVFDWKPNRDW